MFPFFFLFVEAFENYFSVYFVLGDMTLAECIFSVCYQLKDLQSDDV